MSEIQDNIFFRNFSLVVIAIAMMLIVFMIIAVLFAGGENDPHAALHTEKVRQMTAPVGQLNVAKDDTEAGVAETVTTVAKGVTEAVAEAVVAETVTAVTNGGDDHPGRATYDGLCVNCHGVSALASMIPQTGDAAVWEARTAKGIDVLYNNAINGFVGQLGMMPAKGGNPALSDDQVKASVDYMLKQVQ